MTSLTQTLARVRHQGIRRFGMAGLLFFFVKGLVWLALAWLAHDFM